MVTEVSAEHYGRYLGRRLDGFTSSLLRELANIMIIICQKR